MTKRNLDQRTQSPTSDTQAERNYRVLKAAGALGIAVLSLVGCNTSPENVSAGKHQQEQVHEDDSRTIGVNSNSNNDNPYTPAKGENGMEQWAVQYPTEHLAEYPLRQALTEHSANFDKWRRMVLDYTLEGNVVTPEAKQFLQKHYETASAKTDKTTYTDNEILAVVALDIIDATSQQFSHIGREMVPVVLSPHNEIYEQALKNASDAGTDQKALFPVWKKIGDINFERPKDHYFQGEDFGNVKDVRIIVRQRIENVVPADDRMADEFVSVFVLNSDGNGNEQWQIFKNYTHGDEQVELELDTLYP